MRVPGSARPLRWMWTLPLVASLMVPFPLAVAGFAATVGATLAISLHRRHSAARRAACEDARGQEAAVVLGRGHGGRAVALSDQQLAAHALIVGASGAGKSTTMLTILADHIRRGRPVVAIDMKGSPGFAFALERAAVAAGRGLRVWTPDGPLHWNPLAHGNATALKDMLISTERFSEPHYQRAAERYLQIAFSVLHAAHPGRPAQLDEVVAVMEPRRLSIRLRDVPPGLAERVGDYLSGLTPDQESAVRGLGTRLALLSESSAGRYLVPGASPGRQPVDLRAALEGGDVVLMSVNSSVYGKLGAQLGALAIQSLTTAAGYRLQAGGAAPAGRLPATVAIDEFSALGADNVLALLARGRESQVTVLLATQELADLERAGPGFRDQVMGITAVKLAHRQDVHSSAVMIAQLAGTERVWEQTRTLRSPFAAPTSNRGTRRQVEQLVVHPNEIKSLQTGAAVMLTKLPRAQVARLQVTAPRAGVRPSPASPSGRRPPPDQDAPGVTR